MNNPELTQALVNLLVGVVTLAGIIVTTVLVPYVRAHTSLRTQGMLLSLANEAVRAIEQEYGKRYPNQEKREIAIREGMALAERYGIKVSYDDMATLVESAVRALKEVELVEK